MIKNEQIERLGYTLEIHDSVEPALPLLQACDFEPIDDPQASYLLVKTRAGGVAACAGLGRAGSDVVLHSLLVAPSSRGSGVGASLMATAMGLGADEVPERGAIYLAARSARRFFERYGFRAIEPDELPDEVGQHPAFASAPTEGALPMRRVHGAAQRGLDQCAFQIVENEATDAVLPVGAVIFFRQSGAMLEGTYRGGTVRRGHLLAIANAEGISYSWHAYTEEDTIIVGTGGLVVSQIADGRRELRDRSDEDALVLREA